MASYFTLQILTVLNSLFEINVIHGDIRASNFVIRSLGSSLKDFKTSGIGGWNYFALCLQDFSTGNNLNAFPANQTFEIEASFPDAEANGECWEFRNGKEWTFEPDWYGACSVIHQLVMSCNLEYNLTEIQRETGRPEIKLDVPVPTEWNQALWTRLFSSLLNLDHKAQAKELFSSLIEDFTSFVSSLDPIELLTELKKI